MKRSSYIFLILIVAIFWLGVIPQNLYVHAQTATTSAISPQISTLPSLFPTITPQPLPITAFQILQKLDELSAPSATTSSTASSSATQDYCLNVPIIMYHHIEPIAIATLLGHPQLTVDNSYFEEHINYLVQNHYHFLSLGELVHAIMTRNPVPDKSVVITIDDGYIDNYTYAFLIAKKYHALMNFMIPTGLVGQPDYMTWDHLKELAASPYASIYNHTTNHTPLGLVSQEEIISEVTTANQQLKTNLGIKNDIVVYPYGSYSDLAIQTLQQVGMIAALSTDPGQTDCTSNIMKLPRVRVGNEPIENYGF